MIPLIFKLRESVRFVKGSDSRIVISEVPLGVVRVTERGAGILQLCDGYRTLHQVASEVGLDEGRVFKICEYFNKRGFLEVTGARSAGRIPTVTVIIPTRYLDPSLDECLASVFEQDYDAGMIDVIVVADGPQDGIPDKHGKFQCKVLALPQRQGQSHCRNLGAAEAKGEILAFLDSDCVAEKRWIKEIVPYFAWESVGAVGGYVDGYSQISALDRYEKTFSPLCMGKHILYGAEVASTFYVPTCNILVRRAVYDAVGGMREELQVGEDVDFCWRMRRQGVQLLYVPHGTVRHKHRNHLRKMLRRRADYGSSEAILYSLHPGIKKVLQTPPLAAISFLSLCAAILLVNPWIAIIAAACLLLEGSLKTARTLRWHLRIPVRKSLFSTIRIYLSFFYFASFHLVRYYLALLIVVGILFHPLWFLSAGLLLLAASVDYTVKRPALSYAGFLLYYTLEHISYQLGVFVGCVRRRSFGSYVPKFVRHFGH